MTQNPPKKMWKYLLSGVAIGSALGVLFAPRPGKEIRKEVKAWLKESREKSRGLSQKLRTKLPLKKAQLLAAIRAGREALRNSNNHHKRHAVHA